MVAVQGQVAPIAADSQDYTLHYVLDANLAGSDELARLLLDPTPQVETTALAPQVKTESTSVMGFALPFAVMFILFFVITMSGGYMLQSVAKEKENRTAEVLLLSVRPRDLMLGKVLGLGTVALAQMAIWLGGGLAVAGSGLVFVSLALGQALRLSFILLAVVYFLLGYLALRLPAGRRRRAGPHRAEGGQFNFIIILPLLVPFYLNQAFVADPNGGIGDGAQPVPAVPRRPR